MSNPSRGTVGERLADHSIGDGLHLTAPEAANELGVSATTLTDWRAAARGPKYVKVGRRVLYRVGDLREFIAAQVVDPATKKPVPSRAA